MSNNMLSSTISNLVANQTMLSHSSENADTGLHSRSTSNLLASSQSSSESLIAPNDANNYFNINPNHIYLSDIQNKIENIKNKLQDLANSKFSFKPSSELLLEINKIIAYYDELKNRLTSNIQDISDVEIIHTASERLISYRDRITLIHSNYINPGTMEVFLKKTLFYGYMVTSIAIYGVTGIMVYDELKDRDHSPEYIGSLIWLQTSNAIIFSAGACVLPLISLPREKNLQAISLTNHFMDLLSLWIRKLPSTRRA